MTGSPATSRGSFRLDMDFHSCWFTSHLAYEIEPTVDGCVTHIQQRLADIKHLLEQAAIMNQTRSMAKAAAVGPSTEMILPGQGD